MLQPCGDVLFHPLPGCVKRHYMDSGPELGGTSRSYRLMAVSTQASNRRSCLQKEGGTCSKQ